MSYKTIPLIFFPMKRFTKTFVTRNDHIDLILIADAYCKKFNITNLISTNVHYESLKRAYVLKLQYKIMFSPYTIRVKKNK